MTSSKGRDTSSPRVYGHDAEAAVLAAAFHDRDESRGALDARRRQVIEFLDLREADVDLRPAAPAAPLEQLRQPVQGLRPNTTST